MRCVAIVKAGGICGGNRLDLDARDIFGGLDNDLSRTGNACSVPVFFFIPSSTHQPADALPSACLVCPGPFRFFCFLFFVPSILLVSLLAAQKGLDPPEIFFGRQTVSPTWTRSHQSIETSPPLREHAPVKLVSPAPPSTKKKSTRPDWGTDPGRCSAAARHLGLGWALQVCAYITIVARSSQNTHLHIHSSSTTIHDLSWTTHSFIHTSLALLISS